ncbi:transporter substrate-binding domain-containing protein [Aminobacter anthyllidis]|uniref:transporter substrate-binding domain-containing protein n=1 Tax=Aminobacter anthyllidis TaxID=1035067 RepID=UPI0024564A5D|nr:transporter substrate-binding domain-containing protein [Aminobacter anthyllidis]MDH4984371.1 transporter substrate-binding domain-containing protein [Aminobacter anthyllidis]
MQVLRPQTSGNVDRVLDCHGNKVVLISRRRVFSLTAGCATFLAAPYLSLRQSRASDAIELPEVRGGGKIRIGLLWSLTGHLSVIEKPSRDVALYWIDEVNKSGGVGGYQIEPVIMDAKSDLKTYRSAIVTLMRDEHVLATFGGYLSVSRRAVMPLVTENRGLFYYPTCYEGRECWQHIVCTGPLPNQHSLDLIPYMVRNYGPSAYFVGSNYIWARESSRNAIEWLTQAGGQLLGEKYVPLGQDNFDVICKDIKNKRPDWIFSTVVSDSDIFFRKEYARQGLSSDRVPIASLTTSELEVKKLGVSYGEGHILSAPYFQSLGGATNAKFVDRFLGSRFGESGVTHFNMEETYLAFLYFKKSVERVLQENGHVPLTPENVRAFSGGLHLSNEESPEGEVHLDPDNLNSWLKPKIGRFNGLGQIELLWQSSEKVSPKPYLLYPERGVCLSDGLHLPNGTIVKAAS